MPQGKHGYKYVVDLVDNLTGYLEAVKLKRISANDVARFLFDVMCRYGCIFQLTVDNGSEFKGAVQVLMDKYQVPIVRTSPYNPRANGKSERGHAVWISALWKIKAIRIYDWPDYLGFAVWADRVTVKRNTGYTPYYLLYGQHPLMPFDVRDKTFHSLDWPSIHTTEELLALRIIQLSKRDELLDEAVKANYKARLKAADAFNQKHAARMDTGEYNPGEWVIVYNEALDNQHGSKGSPKWFGPFIIVQRRPTGAYVVQQPDGAVLKRPIAWRRLKLYHYRENTEPVVRAPVWNKDTESLIVSYNAGRLHSSIKPWQSTDPEVVTDYWCEKYESWQSRKEGNTMRKAVPTETNVGDIDEEDRELWDYRFEIPKEHDDEHTRFPKGMKFTPVIFDWLPWGKKGQYIPVRQANVRVIGLSKRDDASDDEPGAIIMPVTANLYGQSAEINLKHHSFECNMAERRTPHSWAMRQPSSAPRDRQRPSPYENVGRESMRGRYSPYSNAPERSSARRTDTIPTAPRNHPNEARPSTNDREQLVALIKELASTGEIEVKGDNRLTTPSTSKDDEPTSINLQTTRTARFVEVSDDLRESVDAITSRMDVYKENCRVLQATHEEQLKQLQSDFVQIHDEASTLNSRTDDLLRNLKKTTAGVYKRFDAVDVLQQQAIEAARALKDVLLRVHNDEFSMDDYYTVVHELMRGALTTMSHQYDPNDPRFETFKRDVRAMFTSWATLASIDRMSDVSMASLMEIVGKKKEATAVTHSQGTGSSMFDRVKEAIEKSGGKVQVEKKRVDN
jgi:hypothetical protein